MPQRIFNIKIIRLARAESHLERNWEQVHHSPQDGLQPGSARPCCRQVERPMRASPARNECLRSIHDPSAQIMAANLAGKVSSGIPVAPRAPSWPSFVGGAGLGKTKLLLPFTSAGHRTLYCHINRRACESASLAHPEREHLLGRPFMHYPAFKHMQSSKDGRSTARNVCLRH